MSLQTDSDKLPIKDNKLSKIDNEFAADYGVSVETVVGTGGTATTTTMNTTVNNETMKFTSTGQMATTSGYHIDNDYDIYYNPNTGTTSSTASDTLEHLVLDNITGNTKRMSKYISLTYPNDIVYLDTTNANTPGFKFMMRENTA